MDTFDYYLSRDKDWDPSYLAMLFSQDFNDFSDLRCSETSDTELVKEMEKLDIYCPIVEDISMEDDVLVKAVEQIKYEYVMVLLVWYILK